MKVEKTQVRTERKCGRRLRRELRATLLLCAQAKTAYFSCITHTHPNSNGKLTEQVTEDSDLLWWQLTKEAKICRRMVRVVDTTPVSTLMKCMRHIYGKVGSFSPTDGTGRLWPPHTGRPVMRGSLKGHCVDLPPASFISISTCSTSIHLPLLLLLTFCLLRPSNVFHTKRRGNI
jgi:hypothetical protein